MRLRFHTLDVFTDTAFAGNPLAVVENAAGLDTARMQAIAREFNLSETVFVLEPRDPVNTARVRIFTPTSELPFAGHPTVGAAALIARLRAPELLGREDIRVVLEEGVGDVVCNVRGPRGKPLFASFELPVAPGHLADLPDHSALAAALSLNPDDIGFDAHLPGVWSAGNPFAFVPVRSRAAVARAAPIAALYERAFGPGVAGAFLYARDCERAGSDIHARMFAPARGVPEDPATGSAAAAFAGVAVAFEAPEDGQHSIVIEQGFEMGRPSIIHLGVDVADGAFVSGTIGGGVVRVGEGQFDA